MKHHLTLLLTSFMALGGSPAPRSCWDSPLSNYTWSLPAPASLSEPTGPDPPRAADTPGLSCPPTSQRPRPPGTLLLSTGESAWYPSSRKPSLISLCSRLCYPAVRIHPPARCPAQAVIPPVRPCLIQWGIPHTQHRAGAYHMLSLLASPFTCPPCHLALSTSDLDINNLTGLNITICLAPLQKSTDHADGETTAVLMRARECLVDRPKWAARWEAVPTTCYKGVNHSPPTPDTHKAVPSRELTVPAVFHQGSMCWGEGTGSRECGERQGRSTLPDT